MENLESKIVPFEVSNIATALCNAQATMTGAKKDKKNPFFKSNYADLSSVFDAIKEPFAANGLSVTQTMDILESGRTVLCTTLMHTSGQKIESKMPLPEESNPQKLGSSITYLRRYALMAIAGIPAEDDDGNAASGKAHVVAPFINQKQVSDLEALINGHADIRKLVLDNCNQNMASITVDRYPGAYKWVKDLIEKKETTNE